MRNLTITLAIAALALTGCTAPPAAPAPAEEVAAPAPAEEPAVSSLDHARTVAQAMDPMFADDGVWAATQEAAQSMCDLVDANPALAGSLIVDLGMESGLTGEQVGITWGIASNVYCPEYLDLELFNG